MNSVDLTVSSESESDNSDHSEPDIEDPLPQVVFNLWVIKEGSSKILPGFKQECLDLNTMDYAGLKARLDELVLQKLGLKLRDSKTVSIMYGANWVSGAKAVNKTKLTHPSHYGDLTCVADFDGLRERIRGSLGGRHKSSSDHFFSSLQLLNQQWKALESNLWMRMLLWSVRLIVTMSQPDGRYDNC